MMNCETEKKMKLSEHFTLGEMTKTSYRLQGGNTPDSQATANLRNLCENWLEELRYSYNTLYCLKPGEDYESSKNVEGIVINSGYRSEELNRKCWGAKSSNHLTGCAVDIRCLGKEQMLRYAAILIDLADDTKRDFDELILESRGTTYWIHLAVRPEDGHLGKNRRKLIFDFR